MTVVLDPHHPVSSKEYEGDHRSLALKHLILLSKSRLNLLLLVMLRKLVDLIVEKVD